MTESSHFIKIDYSSTSSASTAFSLLGQINENDLEKRYEYFQKLLSESSKSSQVDNFPDIDIRNLSVEQRGDSLIIYFYGFGEGFNSFATNIGKSVYCSDIDSIYMLNHDFDMETQFVSTFKDDEFKIIYMQYNTSTYEHDHDDLFVEIESREDLLDKFKELNDQGRLKEKQFSREAYIEYCSDLSLSPEEYIFSTNDVDFIADNGETPLTAAIKASNVNAIRMLLEFMDADINMKNGKGESPTEIAEKSQNEEITNYVT